MEKLTLCMRGAADWAARFLQRESLMDRAQWAKFVDVFLTQPDGENYGWRGEYWGKSMRGAALVYSYTKDDALYAVLTESVKDMLTVAEADGRVSSYAREAEFDAWDIWCRKYVMLGCQYYLEACRDDGLKQQIVTFLSRCADYIIAHIGTGTGQKGICDASRSWLGLNSSSILEPMVRLYRLTGKKRYLDFAAYIVREGGAKGVNIFELAYENRLSPYQYGVSKAYEMMSCFEGLLEYYYVTGIEKYKTAFLHFCRAVIDTEVSIIGSCGITHELFDHTRIRQTVRQDSVMQETCVTVTWMKLCARALALTGERVFADEMEKSFYNAYLGALNTRKNNCRYTDSALNLTKGAACYVFEEAADQDRVELVETFLPFDSYSPLIPGKRGQGLGGGQLLKDNTYYGCCAAIGAAGVGVFLENMILTDEEGIVVNFYESGTARLDWKGVPLELTVETDYPARGHIAIRVKTHRPAEFAIKLRLPGWANLDCDYRVFRQEWCDDRISLHLDMPIQEHRPESWDEDVVYTDTTGNSTAYHYGKAKTVYHNEEDDHYVALTRGPLTLAADSRTGKPAYSVFDFEPDGKVCEDRQITDGVPCMLKMEFTGTDGGKFYLVDYASAGHDWQTEIAAWLPTK